MSVPSKTIWCWWWCLEKWVLLYLNHNMKWNELGPSIGCWGHQQMGDQQYSVAVPFFMTSATSLWVHAGGMGIRWNLTMGWFQTWQTAVPSVLNAQGPFTNYCFDSGLVWMKITMGCFENVWPIYSCSHQVKIPVLLRQQSLSVPNNSICSSDLFHWNILKRQNPFQLLLNSFSLEFKKNLEKKMHKEEKKEFRGETGSCIKIKFSFQSVLLGAHKRSDSRQYMVVCHETPSSLSGKDLFSQPLSVTNQHLYKLKYQICYTKFLLQFFSIFFLILQMKNEKYLGENRNPSSKTEKMLKTCSKSIVVKGSNRHHLLLALCWALLFLVSND